MNNRQLAIQELFEGLIMKYGGNPNTKKIITAEIQRFSQNKAKITVQDIEKLEEDIKKLCGFGNSPKPRTKISLSTNDKYLLADTSSDTEKRILPAASPMQTSPYIFPFTAKGKKIVKKAQDHILFPNDSSFYDFSIDSVDSQQTSPVKAKLTGNDEWGNIVKADHLKYLNVKNI